MPPSAANAGRAALRSVLSSPAYSSRLISSPTTKKNTTMSPSLTQKCASRSKAKLPIRIPTAV